MASSPLDPNELSPAVRDGIIASILGGLAMTARLLLSTEPVSAGWVVRRVLAAAITAALVGYGIQDHIHTTGLKMGVVGAAGYAAPECLDYLMRYVKARGDKELGKVAKPPRLKPNGKKKSSASRR